MKRQQSIIPTTIIVLLFSFSITLINAQTDSVTIVGLYAQVWDGFEQEDFDPWYGMMSENIEIDTESGKTLQGLVEVKKHYEPSLEGIDIKVFDWRITSLQSSCDLAVGKAYYTASFIKKGEPQAAPMTFNWIFNWIKNDGKWKLEREVYYQLK